MSDAKVDPGTGYRLLEDGEIKPEWYEAPHPSTNTWERGCSVGSRWASGMMAPCRIKLPEPPAPKSLSLDEILAEQEAKPSDDSADALRYEASFRHGASEAQGWTARVEVSTGAKPSEDPASPEYTAERIRESLMADLPKHDGHYRTLEAKGAEPIERMEALVCRGIPEDLHRIAKRNLNMAMASKHQDRAGEKSGEAWEKELQKAENYLHRAWSGRWI